MDRCNQIANPSSIKPPAALPPDLLLFNPTKYRLLTGSLQYLTITIPDIFFTANTLCQHTHNPSSLHYLLLKCLLRYIKGTISFGLPISASSFTLSAYADADWATDSDTRRSTSGYCCFLSKNLISWTVKKQHTVARSSTKDEYRSLAAATAEAI
ncbi:uncharacterized protein LOC110105439 [Dendrobium catenatum]|uniref:uncharacterized protein LOC110105439 n=1 Tax=Dendrobium catenatum TaxID=906689 RepID=UPI0009F49AE0|nr:uncharacterized protein LOC110105439 [Dendrobium catenatum]